MPQFETPPPDWPDLEDMHFRLEDPVLGRLDLSCETGYIVREYDFSPPAMREVTYDNAFDDGTFDFTQFIGARAVTLDLVLRPTENINGTGVQFSEPMMRDRLLGYTHPSRRPRLIFSEFGDHRVKEIDLRGSDFSAAVTKPRFNELNVSWVAPKGIITSSFLKCETQTMSVLAGVREFSLLNEGNVNAHWSLTITGEVQMPKIYMDGDESRALELEFSANMTDTIVVTSIDRTVRVNGVRVGYRYLSDNSTWFTIPPGVHTMNFESADYTRQGYPFAEWENDGSAPLVTWAGNPPHLPADNVAVPPPWAWTTDIDPTTGQPGTTSISVCYRSTWI